MQSHKMHKSNFWCLLLLFVLSLSFTLLPSWVSGVPLRQQILSDAEGHIAGWQMALNPRAFSVDSILQKGTGALPAGQIVSARIFVWVPHYLKVDIFTWSVIVSFGALYLFLAGVYVLVLTTLRDRLAACLIAFSCIVPIHALGGSTLGFQALGYMPRDLALALIVLILILYFRSAYKENPRLMKATFLLLGMAANYYLSFFANIALTLLFTEVLRRKKIDVSWLWCGILFACGASPTLFEFALKDNRSSPIDIGIMRSYYGYLMAYPLVDALRHYLRRFVLYALCVPLVYFVAIRHSSESERKTIRPWQALAIASFILSVAGVTIETSTVYTKYLISRSSIWFMLSSMVICVYGVRLFFRKRVPARQGLLTVLVCSAIFLGQSNLPSIYQFLKASRTSAGEKKYFHDAVAVLKSLTKEDDVILAPSTEFLDLAATVRTYSERGIYVCYKYGGVSIMDGDAARLWLARYTDLVNVFKSNDARILLGFMERKDLHWAFIPEGSFSNEDQFLGTLIVAKAGPYRILKR